jgi:Golgi phosphoprotein 3
MELSLKEQFLLLAYDDQRGRPLIMGNAFNYSLAGSVLLELSQTKKITVREKLVYIENYKTTGDYVLDHAIEQIRKSRKNRKIKSWVQKFGFSPKKLKSAILDQMIDKRVLRKEEHKVLGMITCRNYYNLKTEYKKELLKKFRKIVLDGEAPVEKDFMLVSLIGTSGLVKKIFSDLKERKTAKATIKQLMKDNEFGKSINDAISAANAAVISAVAASTVVTTASH